MGRKLHILYIALSLALFVTLAGLFCVRILETRKDNIQRRAESFEPILQSVERAYRQSGDFNSEGFKSQTEAIFRAEKSLRILSVYSYDVGLQYLRARSAEDLPGSSPGPNFVLEPSTLNTGGLTRAKITRPMGSLEGRSLLLEGVFRVLDQEDFYPPLRDTVLILVVFSVLTSIFTILLRLFGPTEAAARGRIGMPAVGRKDLSSPSDNPKSSDDISLPPNSDPEDSNSALPASGLDHQGNLEKRLSLEQERSAFNEQDISLALLRFPGLSRNTEDYKRIAREIQKRIAFEDLVFEFEDDGYAVILPNSNLDEAIATVSHFFKSLKNMVQMHPRCGLTSRNGRIVDGARLLAEARKALEKTGANEPENIIGFRPDPGRYRQYISEQGRP